MTELLARLSLPEAIGLSLSIICPSVTAAFNVTLVAQATGPAAPLAFAVGTVTMIMIALSFVGFTHRVAHAGSAYAYIAHCFGDRAGFIAGSALLLTYVGFAAGLGALVGSFSAEALQGLGISTNRLWLVIGAVALLLAWWLAYRDMRVAGRAMLAFEAGVVVVIIGLCVRILNQSHPVAATSVATFSLHREYNGWAGLAEGMIFSILSFAGFEGASTLGEETCNPRRNIPIALLCTVLGSGGFFVFVAYCEVVGYGMPGIRGLMQSEAPLNDLALRYATPQMAIALDFAVAASCFSGVLGALSAAGRILYAIARGGLSKRLARVHPVHRTPGAAVSGAALLIAAIFFLWAPIVEARNFYSYTSTIAVLALIMVYLGVGAAEVKASYSEHRLRWAAICVPGPLILLWVLAGNLYPAPEYPNNLWPYVVLAWFLLIGLLARLRPSVTSVSSS